MARKATAQLELELPETEAEAEPEVQPIRTSPSRAKAPPAPRKSRLRRFLLWTGGALGLAAVVVVPYQIDQFLASDPHFLLPENSLALAGSQFTPAADVTRVFASDVGRSVYLIPLAERRRALLRIDWVKEAVVSRLWPNRLQVRIVERQPIAFLVLPGEGGLLEPALIDAEGVILRPPARARLSLPVLHGVSREQTAETRRQRMTQVADLLRELAPYAAQLSEIDVTSRDDMIVTQLVDGRAIRLRLGNRNYLARVRSFLSSYGEIGRRLPNARTFDLRLDNYFMAEDGSPHVP